MQNGGRIPWSVHETYKISCLISRHLSRCDSENDFKDQSFHVRLKSLARHISPAMHCTRGESGKETFWSQTLRNWKTWTHLKSMLRDSMQRKCFRQKEWKLHFPCSRWTVKTIWRDQVLRTSTLIWDSPDRGEEQGNLSGEADGSSSTPFPDSSPDDGEARNDFLSISGNFINRHHVEPRVKLYVPRDASFPCPLNIYRRDQGYKYVVGCHAGEEHRRLLER